MLWRSAPGSPDPNKFLQQVILPSVNPPSCLLTPLLSWLPHSPLFFCPSVVRLATILNTPATCVSHCNHIARPAEPRDPQLELVYKVFRTEEHAREYYWRFWGRHSHQPLPAMAFVDVSASVPVVGECMARFCSQVTTYHLVFSLVSPVVFQFLSAGGFVDSSTSPFHSTGTPL